VPHLSANPQKRTRIALGLILGGGLLAGFGIYVRAMSAAGTAQWTYFLDTFGLILSLIGALFDFRTQMQIGDFNQKGTKRRGALFLLVGLVAAFGSCWILGWAMTADSHPVFSLLIATALTAGIGAAVDGFLIIGWFGSGGYLDRRIAQQSQKR
jgi:hypothetical protein